ncbi:MAG: hypothetical protein A2904_00625 [Candidatus Staskawiczbacteria bacterium RIFCSPLOWO2_01_FULL_33_9]|uniref:Sushi domain-containing protein n=1 Tax=Candidatus Staskawiczbacteria bacterium RIFCSPLOWO2_01_FULL_33_9 TaxID=1802211 RepID=A0A1G2I602_9BACT|nr:MAG: hypothetical protein A2904_00625 [Candidatus Staskawiczbacteria bacterium RIFCSPLOWO2_01_FULL_33_9]
MKKLSLHSKNLILVSFIALGLVFFSFTFAQTTSSDSQETATEEQITLALNDLSDIYGKPVENVKKAREICNSEQFIVRCAEIGKLHNLYKKEKLSQVNTILEQIKGEISAKLSQCTTAECFLDVAKQLSQKILEKNPQLATQLDLTVKKVEEKREVIEAAKEIGVELKACRTMDPNKASVDLLRACVRLSNDDRVGKFISNEFRNANSLNSTLTLRDALDKKEFICGDNTIEGCGKFCLKEVGSIPPVCREITEKFFGPEGMQKLESAHQKVNKVKSEMLKKNKLTPAPIKLPLDCAQNRVVCPDVESVTECPVGQVRYLVRSSPCCQYYSCKPNDDRLNPEAACIRSGGSWDGTTCTMVNNTDQAVRCRQDGGIWNDMRCQMPNSQQQ